MELLRRGFFDVTIVLPQNRGSSTKNDEKSEKAKIMVKNEELNDEFSKP